MADGGLEGSRSQTRDHKVLGDEDQRTLDRTAIYHSIGLQGAHSMNWFWLQKGTQRWGGRREHQGQTGL